VRHDEQQYVRGLLEAGQSIEDAAEALVMRRAIAEVEKIKQGMVNAAGWAQEEAQRRSQWYYTLYAPREKPVKIKEGQRMPDGTIPERDLWQQPGRQAYKVLVTDLPAFCKSHKLNLEAMTELVKGKRWEVNGWQCVWSGDQLDKGRQGSPPNDKVDQAAREYRKAQDELKTPRKQESVYTPAPPMVVWSPSGK
jgi:hypothetical protein